MFRLYRTAFVFALGLCVGLGAVEANAQRRGRTRRPAQCTAPQHSSDGHCCNPGEEWVPARNSCVCLESTGCALPTTEAATATTTEPPAVVTPPPPPPPRCPTGMAFIDHGDFTAGAAPSVTEALADERPVHRVTLEPYCIDQNEVTVAQYRACTEARTCTNLPTVNLAGLPTAQAARWSRLCNASHTDREDHPVNCVDWTQADAFCRSRGARLPTEAEWEFAARGVEMRTYPWGDHAPGPERANACRGACASALQRQGLNTARATLAGDDNATETSPVGHFPAGLSPYGLADMAGNVMEWTADWFGPYSPIPATNPTGPSFGQERVIRGGHWSTINPTDLRTTRRQHAPPGTRLATLGFRCVTAPTEPPPGTLPPSATLPPVNLTPARPR